MPENNSILEKLDGLEARYEEVSTLITDPSVIADARDTSTVSTPSKKPRTCSPTRKIPT